MRKLITAISRLFTRTTYHVSSFNPEAGTVEVRDNWGNIYPVRTTTNPADIFGPDQANWPMQPIVGSEDGTRKFRLARNIYRFKAKKAGLTTLVLVTEPPQEVCIAYAPIGRNCYLYIGDSTLYLP